MVVKLCAENGMTAELRNVVEVRQEPDYPTLVIIITSGICEEQIMNLRAMGINADSRGFCTSKDYVEFIKL